MIEINSTTKKLLIFLLLLFLLIIIIGCRKSLEYKNNDYVTVIVYNKFQVNPVISIETKNEKIIGLDIKVNDAPYIFKIKNELSQNFNFVLKDSSVLKYNISFDSTVFTKNPLTNKISFYL